MHAGWRGHDYDFWGEHSEDHCRLCRLHNLVSAESKREGNRQLFAFAHRGEWPRCYYDREKLCGDPETREDKGKWHVADMCDCPSCPVRCAIRDELWRLSKSGEAAA